MAVQRCLLRSDSPDLAVAVTYLHDTTSPVPSEHHRPLAAHANQCPRPSTSGRPLRACSHSHVYLMRTRPRDAPRNTAATRDIPRMLSAQSPVHSRLAAAQQHTKRSPDQHTQHSRQYEQKAGNGGQFEAVRDRLGGALMEQAAAHLYPWVPRQRARLRSSWAP